MKKFLAVIAVAVSVTACNSGNEGSASTADSLRIADSTRMADSLNSIQTAPAMTDTMGTGTGTSATGTDTTTAR